MLLVESEPVKASKLSNLLVRYLEPQQLSLRCESCKGQRTGNLQVSIGGFVRGTSLLCGSTRAAVVTEDGVQLRHHRPIDCKAEQQPAGELFGLVALVEHVNGNTGEARSGHFITWAKEGAGWKRCDDAVVTVHPKLPKTVPSNVVLAFYSKLSAAGVRSRGVSSALCWQDDPRV